jgi:hypothetical protein
LTALHIAFSKWDGGRHWEYDAVRLGSDRHGTWLGAPHGTPVRRPGAEFVAAWDHVTAPDDADAPVLRPTHQRQLVRHHQNRCVSSASRLPPGA